VKVRIGAAAVALTLAALAAGCGGDDDAEQAERSSTPEQAVAQIAEVRTGLADALATYKAGDESAADEQVGDTYLQHFELVEGPLEEVDHELTEELEDAIREELRDKMKAGAPAVEVQRLVEEIEAKLDDAESALNS
jgi:hypothetical protein